MIYVVAAYWPFLIAALGLGVMIGWWFQDPRSADDATAWLEQGSDER
jgi:hypothetical protein